MPISSYLVYPSAHSGSGLARRLAALPGCDVRASDDGNVYILVTDTADDSAEQRLQEQLGALPGLEAMALVFRHSGAHSHTENQS